MLLYLRAKLVEGRLNASKDVRPFPIRVQSARRQRKMESEEVIFLPRVLFDVSVQLHKIRGIPLQESVQFYLLPKRLFFDGLPPFCMRVPNVQFHG